MSKELIERLREDGKFLGGNFGKLMHDAADALEAKAAPVGEREAFDKWYRNAKGLSDSANTTFIDGAFFPYKAFQAGAAYQRAQQPSAGVVMPTLVVKESGEWGDSYERGFKAALREFARLNGKEVV